MAHCDIIEQLLFKNLASFKLHRQKSKLEHLTIFLEIVDHPPTILQDIYFKASFQALSSAVVQSHSFHPQRPKLDRSLIPTLLI